jgi:aminomuconate-semialdehyde/2-hydroxymuconate-6-semialdehyde dehydrogenase
MKSFLSVSRWRSFSSSAVPALSSPSFQTLYGPFVNGKYDLSSSQLDKFPVHSPATLEHLCDVISTDPEYVNDTVEIAQKTFDSGVWSRSDVRFRATVLNNIATNLRANIPRLAQLEVAQTGRAIKY